jgi:hypothetical protein
MDTRFGSKATAVPLTPSPTGMGWGSIAAYPPKELYYDIVDDIFAC